jgi:glutamate synthase domain-containing protein 1
VSDARAIIESRRRLASGIATQRRTLEGGCGVIGIVGTQPLPGRFIIRPCVQMRNRGNGKGGGVAAVGLFGDLRGHYAVHVAYLDEEIRADVEREHVFGVFDVAHAERQESLADHREAGLAIRPPSVWRYFARVKPRVLDAFAAETGIDDRAAAEDEYVFQNSFRLNQTWYVRGTPRAFVLSHGRDLMILKGVGYAQEIARFYRLEDRKANLWIGHQRYPTRGRVWHPGGAHPFAGLHEALVHNGDFANYHAVTEYLRQRGIVPLFVTDTEVSVLLFDLYTRVLGYPLEFAIEALAPTPEGDFERLSKRRQRIYRAIQASHLHGSPDGPWFFIVARAEPRTLAPQLIGITDVSMLRPQVFALQAGPESFGAIASEKQAIDAFFEDLASEDPRVPPLADRYWNARGGSCTDGGAFAYTVRPGSGAAILDVRDKFGSPIEINPARRSGERPAGPILLSRAGRHGLGDRAAPADDVEAHPLGLDESGEGAGLPFGPDLVLRRDVLGLGARWLDDLRRGEVAEFPESVAAVVRERGPAGWRTALAALTLLRDRRTPPGSVRRAFVLATVDRAIRDLLDARPDPGEADGSEGVRLTRAHSTPPPPPADAARTCLVVDARGFPPDGSDSVARALVAARRAGWQRFIVYRAQGDRFLGCGLGPGTTDVRIDVYGSSGDYLGSGMDGAAIVVHGDAQDQVGQILKAGRIVVFGNVGQTFLYGAKGGEAFVMGSAAGRPLINAVGKIRAIINGSCLDYCAESFMAGEELGGGFVIINGLAYDERGEVIGLELKYPGNNLFSLASGGACYLNDPYHTVTGDQLNGASFVPFKQSDWNVVLPYLRVNEDLFGISIRHDLLVVDGVLKWPKEVFRKIVASVETEKLDWSSLPA